MSVLISILVIIAINKMLIDSKHIQRQDIASGTKNDLLVNSVENDKEMEKNNMSSKSENIKINLTVNNKKFSATLENNETTKELISMFPITLEMRELNSNEKYNYLDTNLPTNEKRPDEIKAGDIKLFGDNCIVVFYKNFSTPYSYTDIGKIDEANELIKELGSGNVTITFEVIK